jgi:excisionase family DNA binding protein
MSAFTQVGAESRRLLNTAEAARYLGLAENTLRVARVRGSGPAYRKFGRTVRYTLEDLTAYVERSKRTSTSQAA